MLWIASSDASPAWPDVHGPPSPVGFGISGLWVRRLLGQRGRIGTALTCEADRPTRVAPRAKCAPGRVAARLQGRRRSSATRYRVAALTHPRTGLRCLAQPGAIWAVCGSGGDRSKPSDPFLARTADPIPLSIQGVKRATAPQARTPEDAGRRGDRCSGCANAYDVDWKQLVIQRLCGFCAAPRNGGGDRVPIELPAGGAPLLHCREKRGLLRRSPGTSVLIHSDGSLSDTEENRVASWPGSALSKKEPSRRSVFIWRLGGRRPLARA
jgi:hypothetical protein